MNVRQGFIITKRKGESIDNLIQQLHPLMTIKKKDTKPYGVKEVVEYGVAYGKER